jgi:urease accessory protein
MLRAQSVAADGPTPFDLIVLTCDERHLRRRVLTLQHGDRVLVDLPAPRMLRDRDRLVLDDGRHVEVIAADEALYEARVEDPAARARLAWALGNMHARVEIAQGALRIDRDHVLRDVLAGMGVRLEEVDGPFQPEIASGGHHRHHDHAHTHAPTR